ncbi:protein phosphatase 2C domain-containing protein [Actinosynnema sp. NPDC050436]|uniref:PP2C family protein-serine/threonine phosphatase n=1 Tax=Actinosynnema sp. NPDC050436 TaxID=3155659 RepID=UPI0033C761A3
MRTTFQAAAGTDTGHRYHANFDVVHLDPSPLLAVVADGMGDGPGSAAAGRTAVDLVARAERSADGLAAAVAAAQREVGEHGRQLGGLAGCTLTALVETPDGTWLAHLGDSRAYRLRRGLLELLTVDHTMAWLGAVHGWYPFDSPQAAAARYQLTRYVGHPARPEPDLLRLTTAPGDVYLLCTDGIAEQVPYQAIHETLSRQVPPGDKVRALLAAADAAGGNDNSTAIVVHALHG